MENSKVTDELSAAFFTNENTEFPETVSLDRFFQTSDTSAITIFRIKALDDAEIPVLSVFNPKLKEYEHFLHAGAVLHFVRDFHRINNQLAVRCETVAVIRQHQLMEPQLAFRKLWEEHRSTEEDWTAETYGFTKARYPERHPGSLDLGNAVQYDLIGLVRHLGYQNQYRPADPWFRDFRILNFRYILLGMAGINKDDEPEMYQLISGLLGVLTEFTPMSFQERFHQLTGKLSGRLPEELCDPEWPGNVGNLQMIGRMINSISGKDSYGSFIRTVIFRGLFRLVAKTERNVYPWEDFTYLPTHCNPPTDQPFQPLRDSCPMENPGWLLQLLDPDEIAERIAAVREFLKGVANIVGYFDLENSEQNLLGEPETLPFYDQLKHQIRRKLVLADMEEYPHIIAAWDCMIQLFRFYHAGMINRVNLIMPWYTTETQEALLRQTSGRLTDVSQFGNIHNRVVQAAVREYIQLCNETEQGMVWLDDCFDRALNEEIYGIEDDPAEWEDDEDGEDDL